jgi:hypothetical protein
MSRSFPEWGDCGVVEKPHFGARSRPGAETAVRNCRSRVTCASVILSASSMERGEALFQRARCPWFLLIPSELGAAEGYVIPR